MQGDAPVVIPGEDGLNLVPSVVALDEKNQIIVGNAARKYLIETPERAVYSVKRLMGRGVEDIQEELKLFPVPAGGGSSGRRSSAHQDWRADLHAAGDFGAGASPAEAQCRALFRRARNPGGHHRPRIFQRCAAAGHERCRPNCRAECSAAGERTDGGIARLRPGQEEERHRRRFTIWAAARSTFRFSSCTTAFSKSIATNGDTHLGGDDIDNLLIAIALDDIRGDLGLDRRGAAVKR